MPASTRTTVPNPATVVVADVVASVADDVADLGEYVGGVGDKSGVDGGDVGDVADDVGDLGEYVGGGVGDGGGGGEPTRRLRRLRGRHRRLLAQRPRNRAQIAVER